jgi:hypothetical protein
MPKRIISKRRRSRIEDGSRDIYGTIIVLALIVSLESYNIPPIKMLISIIGTLLVIAIAETYVITQKESYYKKRRLTSEEFKYILKHEFQIMLASEIPVLVFVLQYFHVISVELAFLLAKILGLITIFSFSIIIERAMKKPWLQTIIYSLISTLIGFLIIGLKIITK